MCNETEQVDTWCVILDWKILMVELFRSDAEQYDREIVNLLHCETFRRQHLEQVEEGDIVQ